MRLHTRTRLKTATPTTRRPSLERDVSQLPCNTLERCPSAVRIRIAPSAARRAPASTTSREPRSTNDGGSEPAVPGDDGCSREGRAAARVGARRVESPGTRSVIEPAYRPDASTPPRTSPRAPASRLRSTRVFSRLPVGVFGEGPDRESAGYGRRVRRRSRIPRALRVETRAWKRRDTRRVRRDAPTRPSRVSNRDSPPIPRF